MELQDNVLQPQHQLLFGDGDTVVELALRTFAKAGIAIDQLDRSACLDRSIDAFQSLIDQPSIDQWLNRPIIDRQAGLID